jgi:serine/threonine protein kinase
METIRLGDFCKLFVVHRDFALDDCSTHLPVEKLALKTNALGIDDDHDDLAFHELEMLKFISAKSHPSVLPMKHHFLEIGESFASLHFVMDYLPKDLFRLWRDHEDADEYVPEFQVMAYAFQLFHALAHLHQHNIRHR